MVLLACVISGPPLLISLVFWLPGPQKSCVPGNRSHFIMKRDECVRVLSCQSLVILSTCQLLTLCNLCCLYSHSISSVLLHLEIGRVEGFKEFPSIDLLFMPKSLLHLESFIFGRSSLPLDSHIAVSFSWVSVLASLQFLGGCFTPVNAAI